MSKREEFIDRAALRICDQLGDDYKNDFHRKSVKNSVAWAVDLAVEINSLINDFQERTDCGDLAPQLALALKHASHTGVYDQSYEFYTVGDSIANSEGAWCELITLLNAHYENNSDEAFEEVFIEEKQGGY